MKTENSTQRCYQKQLDAKIEATPIEKSGILLPFPLIFVLGGKVPVKA